jgi:hypothetical protein
MSSFSLAVLVDGRVVRLDPGALGLVRRTLERRGEFVLARHAGLLVSLSDGSFAIPIPGRYGEDTMRASELLLRCRSEVSPVLKG